MKHVQHGCCRPETCDGGCYGCTLSYCKNCGQLEGGLPTDCPGEQIDYDLGQRIYHGEVDYRDGQWVDGVSAYMAHGYPNNNPPVLPDGWQGFEDSKP